MPKAEITLPTGAHVTIEGTREEIQALLNLYAERDRGIRRALSVSRRRGSTGAKRSVKGPLRHVLELKQEGFFKTKQSLGAIQNKLSEKGHIYPLGSLSPTLIRLTRRRELARLKDKGVWVYVAR